MAVRDSRSPRSERSASSESDFYNLGSAQSTTLPYQPLPQKMEASPKQSGKLTTANLAMVDASHPTSEGTDARNDAKSSASSSAMDISSGSRSPTPESQPSHTANTMLQPSLPKRKAETLADVADISHYAVGDLAKKRKLLPPHQPGPGIDQANMLLPEQWQYVFTFLSPFDLVKVLRVCRKFNNLLSNIKTHLASKRAHDKPRMLDSDTVWARARKLHFPLLPRALAAYTELQMLQLIGTKSCQLCGKMPASTTTPLTTPYNAGPGQTGVSVIWQFAVRICGNCFLSNTTTDIEILQSEASSLCAGLPYAFRTVDAHYVHDIARQLPGGIPAHLHVNKVYYNKDVQAIVRDRDDVKELGDGATEEWRKGLPSKGKERMTDASRWERWESNLRPGTSLLEALREYDSVSSPRRVKAANSMTAGINGSTLPLPTNGMHPLPRPVFALEHNPSTSSQLNASLMPQSQRPMRNLIEVEQARQARRTNIEQRCLQLQPPLRTEVLQHIQSFQAALQITTPMTDAQWDMLRPRILAQREAAELIVHEKAQQYAALQSAAFSRASFEDVSLKFAREVHDRNYEPAQEPLRRRLGEYADDIIIGQWHGGQGLDQHTAPGFAIQTLQHVHKRYMEDKNAGRIESPTLKAQSDARISPSSKPFLSLDNMKWVYDNKVKPLTENHCRELFICAGCDGAEKGAKRFTFEGLIQHYGAKHTSAFSQGNIVVHWETAEWPVEPDEVPYKTNPSAYLKRDRSSAGPKVHSHARHTPQAAYDHQAQQTGLHYAQTNQHPTSSGSQEQATLRGHHTHHGSNSNKHHPALNEILEPLDAKPESPSPQLKERLEWSTIQVALLVQVARPLWDCLDGVENLMTCVRLQTVMHHTAKSHNDHYGARPFTLDLLTQALHTGEEMTPLRSATGLACKCCVATQTNEAAKSPSYFIRTRNVKLFSLSSLITHFKIHHQRSGIPPLNWMIDMMEVPEAAIVTDLSRASGMNDVKLRLIAEAFPLVFSNGLPTIGIDVLTGNGDLKMHSLASRVLDKTKKSKAPKRKNQTLFQSHEVLPEPAEDEYDPRRPTIVSRQDRELDPARYDTDLAHKSPEKIAEQFPAFGPRSHLPAEATDDLLEMFSRSVAQYNTEPVREPPFNAPQQFSGSYPGFNSFIATPQQELREPSRSPSVGHPSSVPPTEQPDIAAILASLSTVNTPPHQPTRAYRSFELAGQHVALARNTHHFGQNQHAHAAEHPAYTAPMPRSTRSYIVDEHGRYVELIPIDDGYDPARPAPP